LFLAPVRILAEYYCARVGGHTDWDSAGVAAVLVYKIVVIGGLP
jgi:hypothetical protein